MSTPVKTVLRLEADGPVLTAWLDDAPTRNALGQQMREALLSLVERLENGSEYRALVVRGANRTFCSGADLKAMKGQTERAGAPGAPDPIAVTNRPYGDFLIRFNRLPLATFALVEGAAFAGALGLLCVTDAVVTTADARFAVSETALGLVPAQIAPFLVQRIGLTAARRLALTGARFDGAEAARLGIAHFAAADTAAAEALLSDMVAGTLRCAPKANAMTKQLLLDTVPPVDPALLDHASRLFAASLRGEGAEGTAAFAAKRQPAWAAG